MAENHYSLGKNAVCWPMHLLRSSCCHFPSSPRQTGVADASWDTQPPVSSASKGRSLGLHSKRLALGTILSPCCMLISPALPPPSWLLWKPTGVHTHLSLGELQTKAFGSPARTMVHLSLFRCLFKVVNKAFIVPIV